MPLRGLPPISPRFVVTLRWNTPWADINLYVREPDDTLVCFEQPESPHGDRFCGDVQGGLDLVEKYILEAREGQEPLPGVYEIWVNYHEVRPKPRIPCVTESCHTSVRLPVLSRDVSTVGSHTRVRTASPRRARAD